jgi:hypothetical protein
MVRILWCFVSVQNWLLDDALAYLDGGQRKFCEVVAAQTAKGRMNSSQVCHAVSSAVGSLSLGSHLQVGIVLIGNGRLFLHAFQRRLS